MNRILFLLPASLLTGCESGVQRRDEPYEAIWIASGDNRTLAYDLGKGASIGRVEAEVIAVGSNEKYVVAKQKPIGGGEISYYYIGRENDDKYLNGAEITNGPLSRAIFVQLKPQLGLPEFSKKL